MPFGLLVFYTFEFSFYVFQSDLYAFQFDFYKKNIHLSCYYVAFSRLLFIHLSFHFIYVFQYFIIKM